MGRGIRHAISIARISRRTIPPLSIYPRAHMIRLQNINLIFMNGLMTNPYRKHIVEVNVRLCAKILEGAI